MLLRILVIPSDTGLPFVFKRVQFPLKLAFGETINKTQEQSFTVVGLNLTMPAFSHEQFYVGDSRVGSLDDLFIHTTDGKTRNIVYEEVLSN